MTEKFKSCCFTGYRPSKFPFALDGSDFQYTRFENKLIDAVFSLPDEGCYTFYSGMAMGFDIIAAEIVLLLRETYKKAVIKLICAVPFVGQAAKFRDGWRERYDRIIKNADEVILVSDRYFPGCYQRRNEFMIDNSDFVITWFDGKAGGTANTLNYAAKNNRRIVNLNEYGVHEYESTEFYEIYEEDY